MIGLAISPTGDTYRLLPQHTCGDFRFPIVICDVRPSDFGMIMEDWSQRPSEMFRGSAWLNHQGEME